MTRVDPDTIPTRRIPRAVLDAACEAARCPDCRGITVHDPHCSVAYPKTERDR